MIPEYDTIVMSGGGIKGIGLLGSLQYLADKQRLSLIKKFVGTSIGAIIAYFICIGYSPIELMVILNTKKIIEKIGKSIDILSLIHHGGAMNFYILQEILEEMTLRKIGQLLTLKQLYEKYAKHLICCSYNYNKRESEYLDYNSYPDLPCITALRMTSNLPFLFYPFYYNKQLYIDGGIINNFPISILNTNDKALALQLLDIKTPKSHDGKSFRLLDYIYDILYIPIEHVQKLMSKYQSQNEYDQIDIHIDISLFNWEISMTQKFDAFSIGYETTRNFFQTSYIILAPNDLKKDDCKN
jgi:predicted acylesterase/phospholipase RssA